MTAVRKGNAWRIRSEFSVVSSDEIEYQAWDASAWRAKWDCDGFAITSSDGTTTYPSPTVNYLGHVAGEQWQCAWQPDRAFSRIRGSASWLLKTRLERLRHES